MPGKQHREPGPSIWDRILALVEEHGPMTMDQLTEQIPYERKSILGKTIDMTKAGILVKDYESGAFSLKGAVPSSDGGAAVSVQTSKVGIPLDSRQGFIQRLGNIGVTPKEAIPTIADIFFSGDIDSLEWLDHVLRKDAAGFVNAHQARLVLSWWAQTRGLPYDPERFVFEEVKGKGEGSRVGKRVEEKAVLDPGIGWKVGKDNAGDWVAQPGGPLTYLDALAAARERAALAIYAVAVEEEEGEEEGEGKGRRPKRPRPVETLADKLILQILTKTLEGGGGQSDEVKRLTDKIERMETERQEDRFSRVEGLLAELTNRDPWEEYDRMKGWRESRGLETPLVTDQSPAVQIVKDTADKLDKNVNRLVGIIERTALRSEAFTPEETRSAEEQEHRAGQLLGQAEGREKSRDLRRKTFGR